jgi:hypothetical protein
MTYEGSAVNERLQSARTRLPQKEISMAPLPPDQTPLSARLDANTSVYLRRSSPLEMATLHGMIATQIGGKIASLETMRRARDLNADSFWTVIRRQDDDGEDTIAGCYAFLFLNEKGKSALNAGIFVATEPDFDLLAPTGERPACVYMWAIVARKMLAVTFQLISQGFETGLYAGLPVIGRAGSPGGLKALSATADPVGAPAIGTLFKLRAEAA